MKALVGHPRLKLVCSLAMHSDDAAAVPLPVGEIHIARLSGDYHLAHYRVEIIKTRELARRDGPWRCGEVRNFRRTAFGPFDLLLRGLVASVGGRSVAEARSIPDDVLIFAPPASESEAA